MRLTMDDGSAGSRCLRTLTACLLLSVIAVSDGLAGEWEERRVPADQEKRNQGFPEERRQDQEPGRHR